MTNAEKVKEMRKASGLSMQRFGDKYGIPMRTIQEWESGGRKAPDYVIDMLARLEALEKTIPTMYVFEEYRDKAGVGSTKCFTDKWSAIEYAMNEWTHMSVNDQNSYKNDSAGVYAVYLYKAEYDDYEDEYLPSSDAIDEVWTAW